MRIHLKERRQETADVISFVLDLRGESFAYRPGQYVFFELDELAFPDERGKRRHFTIASAPSEQGIVMFTTKLRGSGFKETLRHAPLSYEFTMETPKGSFVMPDKIGSKWSFRPSDHARQLVFVAGGIGVTPYRSMLRHAADMHAPLNATLFYFNRTAADIIYRAELDAIAAQMPSFKLVHVLNERETGMASEVGKLDEAMLKKYVPDMMQAYYMVSGPPPMVNAYMEMLTQLGVSDDAMKKDSFTGY